MRWALSEKRLRRGLALVLLGLFVLIGSLSAQDEGLRKVKSKVDPVYPEIAKRMHLSGTVKIEITITPAGTVKSTKVIGGHPVLVAAALDAVKRWKFEPASGETVEIIPFNFNQ